MDSSSAADSSIGEDGYESSTHTLPDGSVDAAEGRDWSGEQVVATINEDGQRWVVASAGDSTKIWKEGRSVDLVAARRAVAEAVYLDADYMDAV